MGTLFKNQLGQLQKNLEKKTKKEARGISQYFDNQDGDGDDSFDDDDDDEFKDADKTMMGVQDPSKLIDLELVNLLKFCNDLKKKHKETDDY